MKNNINNIAKRFFKVIYVFLLLFGIILTITICLINLPYSYTESTSYTYQVKCNNGKLFDPESKPIIILNYNEPHTFDENQIKSECELGIAWFDGEFKNKPKNYELNIYEYPGKTIVVRTLNNTLLSGLIAIVAYYLILESLKRTLLYIFTGKPFIKIKKHTD